jgi:hypothetical protein
MPMRLLRPRALGQPEIDAHRPTAGRAPFLPGLVEDRAWASDHGNQRQLIPAFARTAFAIEL